MKNNLKIIDKNTLEELSSQLKDYLFKSKTTKLVRDMNKKISDSLITIINNNFNITTLNKLEKQKLSSRLQIYHAEKLNFISKKSKNSRIIRLENDLKE